MSIEQSKHTPGPWRKGEGELMGAAIVTDTPEGLRIIAEVVYPYETEGWTPEDEANANILSAAPDLLEALEVLLMACTYVEGGEAHQRARAAIAKATGGAS